MLVCVPTAQRNTHTRTHTNNSASKWQDMTQSRDQRESPLQLTVAQQQSSGALTGWILNVYNRTQV